MGPCEIKKLFYDKGHYHLGKLTACKIGKKSFTIIHLIEDWYLKYIFKKTEKQKQKYPVIKKNN